MLIVRRGARLFVAGLQGWAGRDAAAGGDGRRRALDAVISVMAAGLVVVGLLLLLA